MQRAFDIRPESTRLDRIRWLADDHPELSREGWAMGLQLQGKQSGAQGKAGGIRLSSQ